LLPHSNLEGATVTLEEKVHLQRLRLFRRVEELGNVSARPPTTSRDRA